MEQAAIRQFVELEQTHFWFVGRRAIFMDLLARQLAGRGAVQIVDVGCGAGGMLQPLSNFGQVLGVDSSPELIDYCHGRGFASARLASAYELPVPDASADVVTLFDTIEHVPDDVRALRECARVLRPGGLVFLSTPAYQFLYANNDRIAHHERRYTARLIRERLNAAGLEPARITYFNTLLFAGILPAVLLKKLQERVVPPGDRTNLSHRIPPRVNRILAVTMSCERRLLAHVDLPFGHSLIALARAR